MTVIFEGPKNEIVERAINGDSSAQDALLKRYDKYINKVSTVTKIDENGNTVRYVDEDVKTEIQMRYLAKLAKCKVEQKL